MGYRDSILIANGYQARYEVREKCRGLGNTTVCRATKNGLEFYAFRDPGHYMRIMAVQNAIPHMAKFFAFVQDVALIERVRGQLLWDLDQLHDIDRIEKQLIEFAEGTTANGLIHGDLRAWNVIADDHRGIRVIDWNLSSFVDQLHAGHELVGPNGHYTQYHPERKWNELAGVDIVDAKLNTSLMRGEIGYREAWPGERPGMLPRWCKP
jgi:hypothetical protein